MTKYQILTCVFFPLCNNKVAISDLFLLLLRAKLSNSIFFVHKQNLSQFIVIENLSPTSMDPPPQTCISI